jgi:glucokinase
LQAVAPGSGSAVAVDVGGTKVEAAWVTGEGTIGPRHRATTPTRDGDALWDTVVDLVRRALADASAGGAAADVVGVGCGGPMSAGGELLSPLNIPGWRDFPLRDRLAERTSLPVFVDHDAKALELAEGWLGAAAGERNYIAMVVSTGVGGGIVCDGRLLDGASGNAGHIGHVIVEPDGHRCACGATGCLEAEASGTAIATITGRPAADATEEVKVRTGALVGRAVASIAVALDLRLACVAGSVALGFGEPFFAAANEELERSARLSYVEGVRIVPAGCGDAGPLLGAAAVGFRGLGRLPSDPSTEATRG